MKSRPMTPVFLFGMMLVAVVSILSAQETDDGTSQVVLDVREYTTYGDALAEQVFNGDGNGIDAYFRNSGVVIDEEQGVYYAVNGVHPVNRGDYTSYYPKSIVAASLKDDTIVTVYSFDAVNGHDVDMEALAFAEDPAYLYIGDEYNYIYEMDLASGEIVREWTLADMGLTTNVDKGIEAMAYSADTGYFYVGIQDLEQIIVLDLNLDAADAAVVTAIDRFSMPRGWAPSGLFAHADETLYVVSMRGRGQAGNQMIFNYDPDGTLLCQITIPSELGMTRPDGIAFDEADEHIYIADSQGPIYGGFSLYKIAWIDPCDA